MKHTIRDPSCVETSAVASGKNVNRCCNIPANVAAGDAVRGGASPNNLGNIAGMRGVGLICDGRVAANARRLQIVGKKQNARITRVGTPLWCRLSGQRHEDRAYFHCTKLSRVTFDPRSVVRDLGAIPS
jgi:hypothetical protein